MAQEIELKLAFPPDALRHIKQHSLIAGARRVSRAQTLENTYYDTPDQALARELVAVRTRRIGRRWLQTIKSANTSAGGLSSRPEWEQPYDHAARKFDFSVVDDPATQALLAQHAESIVPLFTTTFRRETREYSPRPGVRILLMIDNGEVQSGSDASLRTAPISELELELVEGEASDLLDFALQLGVDLPLMPEDVSKAQRGYQLLRNEQPGAARAKGVALDASMRPHAVFRAHAFDCLHAWQANALGALMHDDPEFVHQLRVALRRLRTLLRLFAGQLPEGFADDWQQQLGQLANAVGEARDLDVMQESLLAAPADGPGAPDFTPLTLHLQQASGIARAHVRTVLHSPQARVLLLQFSKALHTLPPEDALAPQPELTKFARNGLRKLHKRAVARLEAAQESGSREDLHSVRIALKRLRYALEFFASLFDGKTCKHSLRALSAVLRELGELNDIAVGMATLQQWAQSDENLRDAGIWVTAWHAAQESRRNRKALDAAGAFLSMQLPWKKTVT